MRELLKFIFLISILLSTLSCQDRSSNKPNIVFILADDLGRHQLGAYGSTFYETPYIDRLANEGMIFQNAYAAATVCSPTRASIMTGKYPARLHLTDYIPGRSSNEQKLLIPEWTKFLPEDETTVAEILKMNGYKTGHFGKWHLNVDKKYKLGRVGDPKSQGFDVVLTTHKPGAGPESSYPGDKHHVREITEKTIEFIEQNRDVPFFAYVSHNSIHSPELENDTLIGKYELKENAKVGTKFNPIQAAMLETLDKSVGRLSEKIKELGLEKNTIMIFFSDNGQLGEKDNISFRGSKGDLYEGGIKMPLIINWPGMIRPKSECSELIISNDFLNTFLEIANIDNGEFVSPDGISFYSCLNEPKTRLNRKSLFWHYPHYHGNGLGPQGAIRKGNYKLVEWFEKSYFDENDKYELYNLENDPGEKNNLVNTHPEIVKELSNDLKSWRLGVGAQEMKINRKF